MSTIGKITVGTGVVFAGILIAVAVYKAMWLLPFVTLLVGAGLSVVGYKQDADSIIAFLGFIILFFSLLACAVIIVSAMADSGLFNWRMIVSAVAGLAFTLVCAFVLKHLRGD